MNTLLRLTVDTLDRVFGYHRLRSEASRRRPIDATEQGHCSACGGAAARNSSGCWWHLDPRDCEETPPGESVRFVRHQVQLVGR